MSKYLSIEFAEAGTNSKVETLSITQRTGDTVLSNIQIEKTVYDKPSASNGKRILVMRLWPRGVRGESVDLWIKDVGTSRELIKEWKAGKVTWSQFEQRYNHEMEGALERKLVKQIAGYAKAGPVTLLCSCKDPNRCHRSLLKKLVEAEL